MAQARIRTGLGIATAFAAIAIASPGDAQTVPTDALATCPISAPLFNSWFESGSVSLNGVVKPADSTVNLLPNCGFYAWTEQMFLWLTSPAPSTYGGGSHIMFSPTFFTVSPVTGGRRTFLRNVPGRPLSMGLRAAELGPHNLPALMSRSGQIIEVDPADAKKPIPKIKLANGQSVTLSDVRKGSNGELQFFAAGKAVQVRKAAPSPLLKQVPTIKLQNGKRMNVLPVASVKESIKARKLVIRGIPIFIDPSGGIIDVEPGQADGGVLLAQNGALIYYISTVNDVFAYFRTMQGAPVTPDPTPLQFPTTAATVAPVVSFAAGKGHTIVDPEALAIETKSSWVEASAVPNPGDYVSVTATIPTYDKSNPAEWVENGKKTVKMVMVGLHVVGSTKGHPEMVWGTMEHLGNAPNASYKYNSTSGLKTVPENTVGTWLFTPSGFAGIANPMVATWDTTTGHLLGNPAGTPIGPSPVMRMHPWGMSGLDAISNTEVISANHAVISQLIAGDVRANYFHLGSTWTIGGAAPDSGNQVGTSKLANATMETFSQATFSPPSPAPASPGTNCFTCHGSNTVQVSHIFGALLPLP